MPPPRSSPCAGTSPDGIAADATTNPCPGLPGADDRPRFVVVAHRFASGSPQKSPTFEVLTLSAMGALSSTGQSVDLGAEATVGEISFTPDGVEAIPGAIGIQP